MGTINITPSSLGIAYGSRPPLGGVVFLRVRPVFSRGRAMSNKMSMEQM
jgi:hypothetical protein